jgi:hypothetical protein
MLFENAALHPPLEKGETFLLPLAKGGGEGFKKVISNS